MMRVLVTGGAGFIGSNLCERLLDEGCDVLCVDNFFSSQKTNIAHLLKHPHFEFLRHDVTFPLFVEIDQIYNLACPASPVQYSINPVQTMKTCVQGAINMLGLAKRTKARILQASTSEIYGDPEVHPQAEDYPGNVVINGPRSCYDEGKRCAETLFFDYHRQYGVDIRVARIFNTYGPRMLANDGRVVSNFIVGAISGKPLKLYGDGSQTRSFCYVDDLVTGLIRFMNARQQLPRFINLGNPQEISVAELAAHILALTGSNSAVELNPLPVNDPRRRCPDITLARRWLNWQPQVLLEEGLRHTIDYFCRARTCVTADRGTYVFERPHQGDLHVATG